jgi:hypothetical protein
MLAKAVVAVPIAVFAEFAVTATPAMFAVAV